jgi:hypothetical protein
VYASASAIVHLGLGEHDAFDDHEAIVVLNATPDSDLL